MMKNDRKQTQSSEWFSQSAEPRREVTGSMCKQMFEKECHEQYVNDITPSIYEFVGVQPENINDESTNSHLDELVKEAIESQEKDAQGIARLKSYFIWSEQKLAASESRVEDLEERLAYEQQKNKELSEKIEELSEKNKELSEDYYCERYRADSYEERLEEQERKLAKSQKKLKKFRKEKLNNGKENNEEKRKKFTSKKRLAETFLDTDECCM